MTKINSSTALIAVLTVGIALLFVTTHDAFAHMSFEFKPGANVNNTVRVVIGETKEPAHIDEEHNLEMTLTHKFTGLRLGNAHRSQTNPATTVLFADTYFYPTSAMSGPGAPAMTGCTDGSASANPANCVPGAGYTDSRIGQTMTTISTNDGGSAGQYRQNTRQFYTEQGITLYRVYGNINYFNDTGVGLIPVNIWADGRNIKKVSICEGLAANIAACEGGDTTYNKTYAPGGGFSLSDKTVVYWPDTATDETHPVNLRKAIGTIRDNNWDIWNFLRDIASAVNSITGGETTGPTTIPPPKNFTHPN